MKHRVYKLQNKFSFLGMDTVDWVVILGTFYLSINTLGFFMGPRVKFVLTIFITAGVFLIWHRVKDNVPEKFGEHFFLWLVEPEVYKIVPDTQNVPLVIDFEKVDEASESTKKGRVRETYGLSTIKR